jgi:hypothetical protein
MITKSGQIEQTIALRQDEMDRVCLKETIWVIESSNQMM